MSEVVLVAGFETVLIAIPCRDFNTVPHAILWL
jgi:hypothetical protein